MANLQEIALGIASALQFASEPEPLPIDLRGQTPQSATFLVRSIIDECVDAGSALKRVRVDPAVVAISGSYRGVAIEADRALVQCIELCRRS